GDDGEQPIEETEVDLADRGSVLRRLDLLFTLIGRAAVSMTLPQSLARSQAGARQASLAVEQVHNRMKAAEDIKRRAAGGSEAVTASAMLAKARSEYEQLRTQADFALL